MCTAEAKSSDHEMRNRFLMMSYFVAVDLIWNFDRTRLVGLAALSGAVTSEALYSSQTEFRNQVSIVTSALLLALLEAKISVLSNECVR